MNCLIPFVQVKKIKTVSRDAEGKEVVKYDQKSQTSYGHSSWLEEQNIDRIIEIRRQQAYYTRFGGVVSGIAALLATVHVPFFNKFALQYKAGGVVGAAVLGYALTGFVLGRAKNSQITKIILENDLIPTWNDKDRVLEKNRVYFFLDDDRGFAPNILYHGISEKQIENMLPDSIQGNSQTKKAYLQKFEHLLANKDPNQTNHLLEELSFVPRKPSDRGAHH